MVADLKQALSSKQSIHEIMSSKVVPAMEALVAENEELRTQNEDLRRRLTAAAAPAPQKAAAAAGMVQTTESWADKLKKVEKEVRDLNSKTQALCQKTASAQLPKLTALRLAPLPGSGNVLKATRAEAMQQLAEVFCYGRLEKSALAACMQVYPPRADRQGKGAAATVFTMPPAAAASFLHDAHSPVIHAFGGSLEADWLRKAGWSLRVHLPLVEFRCKCALYNEHREFLQGRKFHFRKQYTELVVEGGQVFALSPERVAAMSK
jgi:regulator of replication initiation timing